jgi:hypothetical protein
LETRATFKLLDRPAIQSDALGGDDIRVKPGGLADGAFAQRRCAIAVLQQ